MKVMLPAVSNGKTTGISYTDVCYRQAGLMAAQEKDKQWLNSLSRGQDGIELKGFNNHLVRSQGIPPIHYVGPKNVILPQNQ